MIFCTELYKRKFASDLVLDFTISLFKNPLLIRGKIVFSAKFDQLCAESLFISKPAGGDNQIIYHFSFAYYIMTCLTATSAYCNLVVSHSLSTLSHLALIKQLGYVVNFIIAYYSELT